MTDERLLTLTQQIQDLQETVDQNHLILHGNPDLGEDAGVIPRLRALERSYQMISAEIQDVKTEVKSSVAKVTSLVTGLTTQIAHEKKTEAAVQADRAKWLKIIGVVLGGGQAINIAINVLQTLNSP